MYSFEWDEDKNTINQDKHGVSFEEAKTVFMMKMLGWNMMRGILLTKIVLDYLEAAFTEMFFWSSIVYVIMT